MNGYIIDNNYVEENTYLHEDITEDVKLATTTLIKCVLSQLDYSIKEYELRKEIVDSIFKRFGIMIDSTFSYYQESNLNKYINKLYYDKMTKMFNIVNNYLLFSDSNLPKGNYKYYKDDDFKDSGVLEVSLDAIIKNELRSGDNVERQIKKFYDEFNHAEYSIKKIQKDIDNCPYIKDYIEYNRLARDIVENHENYDYDEKQISSIKRAIGYKKNNSIEIDKDVISIVKSYKKYVYFKNPLKESEEIDWDAFDYDNKEHVLALLRFNSRGGFDTDLHMLLYDFNQIVNKTRFSDIEKSIVKLYREELSQTEIAEILNVSIPYVNQCLSKIANKIKNTYWNDYEDWYYTYVCKGTYKKCNICGETKLIKHFGNDSRNKDGKKSICHKCDRENRH